MNFTVGLLALLVLAAAGRPEVGSSALAREAAAPCPIPPEGGFSAIWSSSPELQAILGCPTSLHPRIQPAAWQVKTTYQPFEGGEMIWSDHIGWYAQPVVFVLYSDGSFGRFEDKFTSGVDPISGGEVPPEGLSEPVLGFGKVWREQEGVRDALGWAITPDTPGVGRYQMFQRGDMVWISQTNRTYVFERESRNIVVFDIPFAP